MNFFEQQERAKKNSLLFILLFFVGVVGVIACIIYLSSAVFVATYTDTIILSPTVLFSLTPNNYIFYAFIVTVLIIVAGSVSKIYELSSGGYKVAQSLGGKIASKTSKNIKEITLINIVEEVAIASGIPVPPVYIIEDSSINAFAAGITYNDAVIGVTRGAIDILNRDELQGVIAHEFSHIFNGDMKLNIRAVGILNGILFISLIGRYIFYKVMNTSSKSDKKNSQGSGGNIIIFVLVVAGIVYVIGMIGLFFGNIAKAAINRQREYLADASAVQFTRQPYGIAGALKKIAAYSQGSIMVNPNAKEYSHMFFSKGVNSYFSLASHPQIEKRILAIEPNWDGKFPKITLDTKSKSVGTGAKKENKKIVETVTIAAILNKLDSIGQVANDQLEHAKENIASIPKEVYRLFETPFETQLIIYAILCNEENANEQVKELLLQSITFKQLNQDAVIQSFKDIYMSLKNISRDRYLDLINLSIPTLKQMSKEQYIDFKNILNKLIEADNKVSLFEWNIKYLILYPLDIYFNFKKIPKGTHNHIGAIKFNEVEVLLSSLSFAQTKNDIDAKVIFDNTRIKSKVTALKYIENSNITTLTIENALEVAQNSLPLIRRKLLEIVLICLNVDGETSISDTETIHAFAALLQPPLVID